MLVTDISTHLTAHCVLKTGLFFSVFTNMDSDPSLSCSDTGDGFSELSDTVQMSNLMGAEDLAATLVALKEAPELNRLVQDVESSVAGGRSASNVMMN